MAARSGEISSSCGRAETWQLNRERIREGHDLLQGGADDCPRSSET
jgi:hypothetical protein